MVVFPEPETPVITVRRPLGISTLRGLTVWMASVVIAIFPFLNMSVAGICCLTLIGAMSATDKAALDNLVATNDEQVTDEDIASIFA